MEKKEILAIIAAVFAVFGLISIISAVKGKEAEDDAESLPAVYQPQEESEELPETDIWDVLQAKQEQSATEPVVTDENGNIVTGLPESTQPVQPVTEILEDGVVVEKTPNEAMQPQTSETTPAPALNPAQTEQPRGGQLVIVDDE